MREVVHDARMLCAKNEYKSFNFWSIHFSTLKGPALDGTGTSDEKATTNAMLQESSASFTQETSCRRPVERLVAIHEVVHLSYRGWRWGGIAGARWWQRGRAADSVDSWLVATSSLMDRPLVVGWSLGGRIAMDYLHHYGCDDVSGLVLVGASVVPTSDPSLVQRRRPDVVAEGMYSEDQRVALAATIAFVKGCFASPLSKMDLATMVGFNMLCPPHIRRASRLREPDFEPDFSGITCPVSVFWGEAEKLIFKDMIDDTLAALPHAKLLTFPGTGHAPFWERAEQFDTHLAECARETMGSVA